MELEYLVETNSVKSKSHCSSRRKWWLGGLLLLLALVWVFFRTPLERTLSVHFLLSSNAPREEAFNELAQQTSDPMDFLNRAWATGRIVDRQLVAEFLKSSALTNPPWFPGAEPLLLAGAVDADMSVRELALATLETTKNPRLAGVARAQLKDTDPLVRHLGLNYVRKEDPKAALPVVLSLLDDPDLKVAAGAEVALMHWTGEDYGVRERLAIAPAEGAHTGQIDPANAELIRQGIAKRKTWWQQHAADYSTTATNPAVAAPAEMARNVLPDFTLKTLDGKTVHLSDFRGKTVLINFWATWCTACLAEIPDLVALQKKVGGRVVILGVALDGVPDEHGHDPGAEAGQDAHAHETSLNTIRERVLRAVKSRGINYPVLLDAGNSVGAEFNGGELPTTVIIDAEGRLRRRFIGERNVAVFEQMIQEVSQAQAAQ